ncbi:MAG: PAS domain-containing sensor histidine kinase, partial [Muribaculaceae bacterium]|nr:PAS domain-containing sensor histidine kinase [Muribaculaceae bacterium]
MKLRVFFIILTVFILVIGGIATVSAYSVSPAMFYAAEGIVVAALLFLIFFYRRIMRPLDALANGLDILRAQDWNTTLRRVGQSEVDNIVDTFNLMLLRLKDQRIRYEERSRLVDLLIQAAPAGVAILDFDGTHKVVNEACRAMLDASDGLDGFLRTLARGDTADYITAAGGTLRCSCHSFIDRGVSHGFYIIEDITASVSAAERAAYEKIIRIISHEVNNTVAGLGSAFDTL